LFGRRPAHRLMPRGQKASARGPSASVTFTNPLHPSINTAPRPGPDFPTGNPDPPPRRQTLLLRIVEPASPNRVGFQ